MHTHTHIFFSRVLILHDNLVEGKKKIKGWISSFSTAKWLFKSLLNARICLYEKLEFGMFIQP